MKICRLAQSFEIKIEAQQQQLTSDCEIVDSIAEATAILNSVATTLANLIQDDHMQVDQQLHGTTVDSIRTSSTQSNELNTTTTLATPMNENIRTTTLDPKIPTTCIGVLANDPRLTKPIHTCPSLRSSLIKSLVNFLRKATQYAVLSEHIRPLMTGKFFLLSIKFI